MLDPEKLSGKKVAATVGAAFGEAAWIVGQSHNHGAVSVKRLVEIVLPLIGLRQFKIFRQGNSPAGLALWAFVDDRISIELEKSANVFDAPIESADMKSGDNCWLLQIIAVDAVNVENYTELMFADLVTGPLKGKDFSFRMLHPETRRPSIVRFDKTLGDKLTNKLSNLILAGAPK